jgi:hypothetical protein
MVPVSGHSKAIESHFSLGRKLDRKTLLSDSGDASTSNTRCRLVQPARRSAARREEAGLGERRLITGALLDRDLFMFTVLVRNGERESRTE